MARWRWTIGSCWEKPKQVFGAMWLSLLTVACAEPAGGGTGSLDCRRYPTAPACAPTLPSNDVTQPSPSDATVATDTTTLSEPDTTQLATPDATAPTDTATSECVGVECSAPTCTDVAVAVSGVFAIPNPFVFDHATVLMRHKRDVDPFEDRCVTSVHVALQRGVGCTLVITAGGALSPDGSLRVERVELVADSQCPGFPDEHEGLYTNASGMQVERLHLEATRVPDANSAESCFSTTITIDIEGVMRDARGLALEVGPSSFRLSGVIRSVGQTEDACPCAATCEPGACGSDGCGGTCGACADGERCDASRRCVCEPDCRDRDCGSDGCGGSCGTCAEDELCILNACACQPDCGARTCGDDGCGEPCGLCGPTQACFEGSCVDDPNLASCDGQCGNWLEVFTCPNDCCGDGSCDGLEGHLGCPSDCALGCGDLECAQGEDAVSCPIDCTVCGDDVCALTEYETCFEDCLF